MFDVVLYYLFFMFIKLKNLLEVRIYFLFIYLYFDLFIRILLIKFLFLQKNK